MYPPNETNQKPWKTMKPPWKAMETRQNHEKPWKHLEKPWQPTYWPPLIQKLYITDAGSQLTTLLMQGHNWPPLIQKRDVTHGGANRPFRCLDLPCKWPFSQSWKLLFYKGSHARKNTLSFVDCIFATFKKSQNLFGQDGPPQFGHKRKGFTFLEVFPNTVFSIAFSVRDAPLYKLFMLSMYV